MISAKRNKEGVVEITLDKQGYYFIDFSKDNKFLYLTEYSEPCKIIAIENPPKENEAVYFKFKGQLNEQKKYFMRDNPLITEDQPKYESKYKPTHDELLEWGFINIPSGLIKNCKEYLYAKNNIAYLTGENVLVDYPETNNARNKFPFHTKQDFMKCIGVEEIFKGWASEQELPNVSDFKITYIPSEEMLLSLGFKKYSIFQKLAGYELEVNGEFSLDYRIQGMQFSYQFSSSSLLIHLHSDSELKTIIDILSREK